MTQAIFQFPRAELAKTLADEMQGVPLFGQYARLPLSGTFLSAPRRVGKSTFLLKDLKPQLEAAGHIVVYVDLWDTPNVDPALVLHRSLYAELLRRQGRVKRAIKAIGLTRVSALSVVTVDLSKETPADGVSLTTLLTELADKSKTKKVVLIVDEAQEALTTAMGESAMFSLKAARDALNLPSNPRLMLLCTGSSRSKLSGLVTGKHSPFYGARVVDFPVLGEDFVRAYTKFLNATLSKPMRLDEAVVGQAFEILSYQPEALFATAGIAFAKGLKTEGGFSAALLAAAKDMKANTLVAIEETFQALPLTQQAVLLALIGAADQFTPFARESLTAYAKHTGSKVSATSVQSALEALVQKDIAWQAKRGGYAVDDPLWEQWWMEKKEK